ncbi:type II secretion system protein GspM [Chromatiaceae bacterium AAb-1]|nr:type II secretion system protein GspM [Chromatiaceae bacterium AAb-1]
MKQQLLGWWYGLQVREQQLVMLASAVLAAGVFYWLVWQPVHQQHQRQQQALLQAQQQLHQLQQALPQLRQAGSATRTGGSLAQIISNSARTHGIQVSRMQPQNEQLQLVLEDVSFEQLLQWLYQLQYQHGVNLINLDLSESGKSGIVRVRRMVIE